MLTNNTLLLIAAVNSWLGPAVVAVVKFAHIAGRNQPQYCLAADWRVSSYIFAQGCGTTWPRGGSIVVASRAVDTALSTMRRSPKRLEYM